MKKEGVWVVPVAASAVVELRYLGSPQKTNFLKKEGVWVVPVAASAVPWFPPKNELFEKGGGLEGRSCFHGALYQGNGVTA